MTVSYSDEVLTSTGFGCFLKLLRRWRGSIYKLIWPDLIFFLAAYFACAFTYRVMLSESQRNVFENVVNYCHREVSAIPLSFVLGFYVSLVVKRWWDQFIAIPIPDALAVFVSSLLHGQDDRGRIMRRSIMRYVVLSETMVLTSISPSVKKRFPTYDHLVSFGLMTENEKSLILKYEKYSAQQLEYWMPITWAASIVTRARKEGRLQDDFSVKTLIDELNKFRRCCGLLLQYDTLSIPLVYTQVVTLVVYSFFGFSIMGAQWIDREQKGGDMNDVNYYFPVFITLEFFFYVGWLKVAETLINPFGENDDDFELNFTIDRDWKLSYFIVDEMHHKHPELLRDQYWNRQMPTHLPYFNKSKNPKKKIRYEEPPRTSTAHLYLKQDTQFQKSRNLRQSLGLLSFNFRKRLLGRERRRHIDPPTTSVPLSTPPHTVVVSDIYIPKPSKSPEDIFDSSSSDEYRISAPTSEFEILRQKRKKERMERNDLQMENLKRQTLVIDHFNNVIEVRDSLEPRQTVLFERISTSRRDRSLQPKQTTDTEPTADSKQALDSQSGRGSIESRLFTRSTGFRWGSHKADAQAEEKTDDEKSDKSEDDNKK